MRQNGIESSAEALLKYRGILRIFALSRIPRLRYYDAMEMEEKGKRNRERERENMGKKDVKVTTST